MPVFENSIGVNHQIVPAIEQIREEIADEAKKNGRIASEIQLIAVSKTKPDDMVLEAMKGNVFHFGENKMQDLADRMDRITHPECSWHMIGTLQSNKIKYIASRVNWIQTAAKASHLEEIDKQAAKFGRKIKALIQVNISNEDQKSGCEPSDLAYILETACSLKHVQVEGLMGIAAFIEDEKTVRTQFEKLRILRDNAQKQVAGTLNFQHLSMGMTHDFRWAIAEGATMVRIGSALFGNR